MQVLTIGHTCSGSCSCSKKDEYPYIDRNPECLVEGHAGPITSVAFSPDGTRVASFSHDSLVKIWHAATGALVSGVRWFIACGEVAGMFRRCFEPW